ncbi:unnamed protein product [Caenorhabditis bovis]|uniref:Maelstrom domain-containing protein n=1 Tax=Caenorhabditis bovis TaxID=2654633 RepID=A0A8S1ERK5_9PELO|nr:unnamed protein product [Caenorhabditis bovis]
MRKQLNRPNQAARKQMPDLTTEIFDSTQIRKNNSRGSSANMSTANEGELEHNEELDQASQPQLTAPPPSPETSSRPNVSANSTMWNQRWDQEATLYTNQPQFEEFTPVTSLRPDRLPNPFANRRRFTMDPFAYSRMSSGFDGLHDMSDELAEIGLEPNVPLAPVIRPEVMLPAWWKTRSFSSASCYYPQNAKSQSCHQRILGGPANSLEDIDAFLAANSQHSRRSDIMSKKERWARIKARKKILRRPVEDEYFNDADEEEEIMNGRGVMLNQIIQQGTSGQYEDADLLRKYRRDVAYIKEVLMAEVDGNVDRIRELRFLIASVQTYGNIDGQCMMAELAMNEFTLFAGVLERFHAIVGPWSPDTEIQRRRASRHAFETHKIPLQHNLATMSMPKLIEEILGRSEPSIAYRQGVKVGLYSDTCDEQFRVQLNIKNTFKDPAMIVDVNERRFILVLQNELDLMVDSMKHLAETVELPYEGFPANRDRYVIVEAFVEAIAEIIGESIGPDTMRWFGILGQKVSEDSTTPWERNVELHCNRHSEQKNDFCAQVTVCRATFIILHVLGSFFRRYHLRKIPSNLSTTLSQSNTKA